MISITDLPSEVVVLIAEACRVPEKSALVRINQQLNNLLTPILYRYNIQREGSSAMFWAAQRGRTEILERLVSYGAEVNDNTASRFRVVHRPYYPYGPRHSDHDTFFTPLHIAAKFGQDDTVKWLLKHGARIEAMAHNLCACQDDVVDIANDNDFNPRFSPLVTALHIAICNGHLETAKLLVSYGADVDVGIATPLHTAARYNNTEAVSFLLENELFHVEEPDRYGHAPLHLACMEFRDLVAMEKLLEFGADLETNNDDGMTPLAFACDRGYFNAALKLLDKGANHDVEWDGQTPIQAAALSMRHFFPRKPPPDPETWEDERETLIRRLLEFGVDVDETGGLGTTPLHIAAAGRSLARTLQCFLVAGANIHSLDDLQQQPLHVAFESGHLPSIMVNILPLLRQGAQLDAQCIRGCSAFDCALEMARARSNYTIIDFILQHATAANFSPGFLNEAVTSSCHCGRFDECRVLIRHGAEIDISRREVRSQLSEGIEARKLSKIQFFLDTFPDHLTSCGALKLALETYICANDSEMTIIRALLDRPDLQVSICGDDDATPLHVACKHHHNLEVIQRLLDRHSEVNIFDKSYETPLSYSVRQRCSLTVKMLLRHGADPYMTASEEDWHAYVNIQRATSFYSIVPDEIADDHHNAFHLSIENHCRGVAGLPSCQHGFRESHLEILLQDRSLPPLPTDPSQLNYVNFATSYPESLAILLQKGADPNAGGHCEQPPLVYTVKSAHRCIPEVIAMLLRYGADIHQKCVEGESFLDFFKKAIEIESQLTDDEAEFKDQDMERICTLVRHFHVVVDADSGNERINPRPEEEVKIACRDLSRRKNA
ncbi:Ankyrin-1 [Cytospora mali]|uniref:Ankyrin-1 n=1 Tax=Cytospora mali TaxID=578113 RepID=A0A194V0M2_CYTMA|nr:Ankyrin-1 [Valsa mali var. pyri (nom. inval.)]